MKHDPLELPSGSFELSDLERIGNDAAAAANDAERAKVIRDGLTAANKRIDATGVPGMLPDHTLMPVNRVIEPGVDRKGPDGSTDTVGRIVVQELVQVYDPKTAEEQQPATEDPAAAGAETAAADAEPVTGAPADTGA